MRGDGQNGVRARGGGGGADAEGVEADKWADWVVKFLDENPAIAAIEDVAASAPKADYETWGKVRKAVEGRYRSLCCAVCEALLCRVSCMLPQGRLRVLAAGCLLGLLTSRGGR